MRTKSQPTMNNVLQNLQLNQHEHNHRSDDKLNITEYRQQNKQLNDDTLIHNSKALSSSSCSFMNINLEQSIRNISPSLDPNCGYIDSKQHQTIALQTITTVQTLTPDFLPATINHPTPHTTNNNCVLSKKCLHFYLKSKVTNYHYQLKLGL